MATTFYTFQPTPAGIPFQFQPTLDGNVYLATVRWNVFGQRWYIALDANNGVPVFNQALISSMPAVDLQTGRWENGRAYLQGIVPWVTLGFEPGITYDITVRGCLPEAYNGRMLPALAHDEFTLSYPLPTPPGDMTKLGQGSYDTNMAGGYFRESSLVYRESTRQFEVFSP
jgi:hypothetical protein